MPDMHVVSAGVIWHVWDNTWTMPAMHVMSASQSDKGDQTWWQHHGCGGLKSKNMHGQVLSNIYWSRDCMHQVQQCRASVVPQLSPVTHLG